MAIGSAILVPVTNPASVPGLMDLAARIALPDGGCVIPVTVVRPESGADDRETAKRVVIEAEERVRDAGVEARGLVIDAATVAQGVLDATADRAPTLVLMGWRGHSTTQNVFSEIIDSVVGRSSVPLAVVRLRPHAFRRLLLPLSEEHLAPAGAGGLQLAASLAGRLHGRGGAPVRVLRTGAGSGPLPEVITALSDRVHHDPRRYHVATGAAADASDLVIVPVPPTVSGLRSATTHVAWNLPDSSLLVAVDVGPQPRTRQDGDLGEPAPSPPARPVADQLVTVTVRLPLGEAADPPGLAGALAPLGRVSDVAVWQDDAGRNCLHAEVQVPPESGGGVAVAMSALHDVPALTGAELRYELKEL